MTDIPRNDNTAGADCGGCSLHDALSAPAAMRRREFLRAGALVLASLGLLGAGARSADAMELDEVSPLANRSGDARSEKRYPIPTTDGATIDKDNDVIVARAAGKVYAFALSCPHQNTALRWNADEKQFTCPKHKSHYRADGSFIDGRSTRDMDRLAVRKDGQTLVVDVDTLYQQDLNAAQWAAAYVSG